MLTAARTHLSLILALTGSAALILGVLGDGFQFEDLATLGSAAMVGAIARLAIRPALRPQEDIYDAGYETGHDIGYHEGRRASHLHVVPMREDDAQAN